METFNVHGATVVWDGLPRDIEVDAVGPAPLAGKSRLNERKHGLDFDTARLVFNDPLAGHRPDPGLDEERWHTIGVVDKVAIIVVHTWPSFVPSDGGEVARIISARKATPHERRAYEEGQFE